MFWILVEGQSFYGGRSTHDTVFRSEVFKRCRCQWRFWLRCQLGYNVFLSRSPLFSRRIFTFCEVGGDRDGSLNDLTEEGVSALPTKNWHPTDSVDGSSKSPGRRVIPPPPPPPYRHRDETLGQEGMEGDEWQEGQRILVKWSDIKVWLNGVDLTLEVDPFRE